MHEVLLQYRRLSGLVLLVSSLLIGLAVGMVDHRHRQVQRRSLLQADAQRSGIELVSQTLDGKLMGAISLLGLMDDSIKREASNQAVSVTTTNLPVLTTLGETFAAEGVFVVGSNGLVKAWWDRDHRLLKDLDLRSQPYFQIAIQGKTSVYAANSQARGDRVLHFAAPIYSQRTSSAPVIGVLVATSTFAAVDAMLKRHVDGALLLSPQREVFASSRPEWIGMIEGEADAQRLTRIGDLKQSGAMFEKSLPPILPVTLDSGLQTSKHASFAVASAKLNWNDPSGQWTIVLLEDVARTVAWSQAALLGALTSLALLLPGWLAIRLLQSRHTQAQASLQLQGIAKHQEASLAYRTRLAELSVSLQRCRQLPELAHMFLQAAGEHFGAVQGVIYLATSPNWHELDLVGTRACATPPPARLALRETLLGQCARERLTRIIPTPPPGYWTLRSGLGNMQPAALVLAPLLIQDKLLGVVELALQQQPDELAQEMLGEALALLTSAVETLNHNLRLQQDAQSPTLESTR